MTTPAVNININTPENLTRCTQSGNPGAMNCNTSFTSPVTKWEKKLRPASGTSPFNSKKGWRPCRAWSHSGHNWKWNGGTAKCVWTYPGFKTTYTYPDGAFWSSGLSYPAVPAFPSSLKNRAEQAALLKLKDQQINLGQFVAEWRRTANLLATGAQRIARSVREYKGRNPRAWHDVTLWQNGNCLRKNWHKIPRSWLELQYGWLPLMSDIYGAAMHLLGPEKLPLVNVKGYAEDASEFATTKYGRDGGTTCKATYTFEARHKCHVSLHYKLTDGTLAELSSLGLINPAEIVWELTPYSFVVDWFLPIGNWLSSMTAAAGYSFQGGSCSRISKVKMLDAKSVYGTSGNLTVTGGTPKYAGEGFYFERTCYDGSPVPGLYFKSPLSATHMANALALLVLAFRK